MSSLSVKKLKGKSNMLEVMISARKLLALPAVQLDKITTAPGVTISTVARSRVIRCSQEHGRDLAQQLINLGCVLEPLVDALLNGTPTPPQALKRESPTRARKPLKVKLTQPQADFRDSLVAVITQQIDVQELSTLMITPEPTPEEAQQAITLLGRVHKLNPRAVNGILKKLWKRHPQLAPVPEELVAEELVAEELTPEELTPEELVAEELVAEELVAEELTFVPEELEELEELTPEDPVAEELEEERSPTEPPEDFWNSHEDDDEEDDEGDAEEYAKPSWVTHLTRFRAGKKINNFEVTVVGTALHVLNMQYNPSSPSGEAIDALLTSLEEVARGAVHFNVASPHHATGFKVFDQGTAEEMYAKLLETADYLAPLPANVINLLAVLKDLLNCHHLD